MPTAPFDLDGFAFSPGNDDVIVDDTVNVDDLSLFQILGIFNESDTDTQGGDDTILGRISGTNSSENSHFIAGIYNFNDLDTGNGADTIDGEVDYDHTGTGESSYYGLTSGILGAVAPIRTGRSDDVVSGTASVDGRPEMVVGIGNTDIDTGSGTDAVTGTANVVNTVESSVSGVAGIYNSHIATGKGDDDVTGVADVTGDASVPVSFAFGITGSLLNGIRARDADIQPQLAQEAWVGEFASSTSIDSGKGSDLIEGTATVDAGSVFVAAGIGGSQASVDSIVVVRPDGASEYVNGGPLPDGSWFGFDLLDIDMGAGNDDLIGTANVTAAGPASSINGISGVHADTGKGSDYVEGTADVRTTNGDNAFGINGIANSHLETGKGGDTVLGQALVQIDEGGFGSSINGLCNVVIDTGKSDDVVQGISDVSGSPTAAGGSGIMFSNIDTGDGNDTVTGTSINPFAEGSSFGISNTTIELGKGNDEVVARGASEGVSNVQIFGEDGDDVFDLDGGTGLVDGGDDDDLLILDGNSGDFAFTDLGGGTGTINDLNGTNLNVANIEQFEFDNGVFDFDTLF